MVSRRLINRLSFPRNKLGYWVLNAPTGISSKITRVLRQWHCLELLLPQEWDRKHFVTFLFYPPNSTKLRYKLGHVGFFGYIWLFSLVSLFSRSSLGRTRAVACVADPI
jgi:hypothetical protein